MTVFDDARISCCINGCRRTFRNKDVGRATEYMCGKHYRADQGLVVTRKWLKARLKRLNRLLNAKYNARQISADSCDAIFDRMEQRLDANWEKIKVNAQALQDAGYWAPRPRRRLLRKEPIPDGREKQHAARFEDQFQRMKAATPKIEKAISSKK